VKHPYRPRNARLTELIRGLQVDRVLNPADPVITSVTSDSRDVRPGTAFVAIKGAAADGHQYVPQAAQKGAGAVVCQELPLPLPNCPVVRVADSRRAVSALAAAFYGHPSSLLRVTGVTGTDGKTSTTEILREILDEAGHKVGSIGTLGYCFRHHRLDSDLTTPDPVRLHEAFGRMWAAGLTDVCMEVSSHSLVQHRVADVEFDLAVLTNITSDHLDLHGTRQSYARAKRMLFESLGPEAAAVLPVDCEFGPEFQDVCTGPVLTYGVGEQADVSGRILRMGMDGMEIAVATPFESYTLRTSLTGDYNCANILAAATAAFALAIPGRVIATALRGFRGVPGRLERVRVPGRTDLPAVCVDFAHTPGALDKVLTTLRALVKGRLICVAGCGGDRDALKRPEMGRIAVERADLTVFTADNSRSERTDDIIAEMLTGIPAGCSDYRVEPDRRRAIELAIGLAHTPESMVVICGRGCEKYLKIADSKLPFDDRVVAGEIMAASPLRRRKTA